jgi:hypothetical protein
MGMKKWKTEFKKYKTLLEEIKISKGILRFNKKFVAVHELSSQLYCEKEIELRYQYGKVETVEEKVGKEAHERLTEKSEEIELEDVFKNIFEKKTFFLQEFLLAIRYKDLYIMGRPDMVYFVNGNPLLLFEYKFSQYNKPFEEYHLQAQAYGMLLQEMGFKTAGLYYVFVITSPESRKKMEEMEKIPELVLKEFRDQKMYEKENGMLKMRDAEIFIYRFNPINAQREFDWALDFWTGKRAPLPANHQKKCLICAYKEKCGNFGKN